MTARSVRVAVAAVRAWTRMYTWRLPNGVRERRLAEIESDLWESQHDEAAGSDLALNLIVRVVLGIVDDMRWRAEQVSVASPRRRVVSIHRSRRGPRILTGGISIPPRHRHLRRRPATRPASAVPRFHPARGIE